MSRQVLPMMPHQVTGPIRDALAFIGNYSTKLLTVCRSRSPIIRAS